MAALRKILLCGVVCVSLSMVSSKSADAWWHHWGWHGYYAAPVYAYTPVVTYSPVYYTGWHGCGWRGCGWRHAYYYTPTYYYSGCCDPCYTSYTVSSCCGDTVVGSVQKGGTVYSGSVQKGAVQKSYSVPSKDHDSDMTPPSPTPATDEPLRPASATAGEALLTVEVPADAQIFVNDTLTTTPGETRKYVSRGLADGFQYTYEVRAVVDRDGEKLEQSKRVQMKAGEDVNIAFDFSQPREQFASVSMETRLTVHVPADAKVYLAGRPTRQTGEVRHFITSDMTAGEKWNDYTIRVEWQQDGRTVSREESITLVGGETKEMHFGGEGQLIAAR